MELKRYFNLVMWLMAYAFVFIFAASFFAEQDAAEVVLFDPRCATAQTFAQDLGRGRLAGA